MFKFVLIASLLVAISLAAPAVSVNKYTKKNYKNNFKTRHRYGKESLRVYKFPISDKEISL